jgi:hypothetical protein
VDWIHLSPDRDHWRAVVNTVMNLGLAQKAGNFLTILLTVRFSRQTLLHAVRYYLKISYFYFLTYSFTHSLTHSLNHSMVQDII